MAEDKIKLENFTEAELKKAIKKLNNSGMLDEKIKLVGKDLETLIWNYCDAVDDLEEDGEDVSDFKSFMDQMYGINHDEDEDDDDDDDDDNIDDDDEDDDDDDDDDNNDDGDDDDDDDSDDDDDDDDDDSDDDDTDDDDDETEKEEDETVAKETKKKKAKKVEAEEKDTKKKASKKKASKKKVDKKEKKATPKKAEKKATPKKEKKATPKKAEKKVGVIATIMEFIRSKGPVTKEEILAYLVKTFPDREEKSMKQTIQAQIGGKKSPCRMEREKLIKFNIDDDGTYVITGKRRAPKK